MRSTRKFRWIIRTLALVAGLSAALSSQAALDRRPAKKSDKKLAELIDKTPEQKFEWSYRGCKRVDVPSDSSETPSPALSVTSMKDGEVSLKASIKAPSEELRIGQLELPSRKGEAKQIGFRANRVSDGGDGRRIWQAHFDRRYNQSFHDLGLKRITYEEIGSDPAQVKRVFTLTVNLTEDVRAVFEGGLLSILQYSSDGDFLDRMVETKPSGSWFNRVFTVSRQQVLGQCGNGFQATLPEDWRGVSGPTQQNVPDSVAEQRKFAMFIPHLKTPLADGKSVEWVAGADPTP